MRCIHELGHQKFDVGPDCGFQCTVPTPCKDKSIDGDGGFNGHYARFFRHACFSKPAPFICNPAVNKFVAPCGVADASCRKHEDPNGSCSLVLQLLTASSRTFRLCHPPCTDSGRQHHRHSTNQGLVDQSASRRTSIIADEPRQFWCGLIPENTAT